jgi:hypothetical protein
MPYVVETALFKAEGALVDWNVQAGRLNVPYQGKNPKVLQLRWMIHPDLGMPTEPFIVWRRAKTNQGPVTKLLSFTVTKEDYLFGSASVTWTDGPMMRVAVDIQASVAGLMIAYAGSPTYGSMTEFIGVSAGTSTVVIDAPEIDGLIIGEGMTVTQVSGIPVDWLVQAAGWQQLEIVGLPVVKSAWGGIGKWGSSDQGMVGALTDPGNAAVQRLTRGAPQLGWQPKLPTGESVPAWVASNASPLVAEARNDVLAQLRPVMATVPNLQITRKFTAPAILENSSGQQMPNQNNQTSASPLALALLAAGTDPWYSLALGFGTAYAASAGTIAAAASDALLYDYMVTARWEKGLDGVSALYEMAALVPTPTQAAACPTPANLSAALMGYLRPLDVDLDWRCSVRTSWDRFVDNEIFRPRTYAFVRVGLSPAEAPKVLMQPRASGGLRYLVINGAASDPLPDDWWQLDGVDRELPIPLPATQRTNRYGICQQDIYGQWSPWSTTDITVAEPAVDDVRIVSASLRPSLPANPNSSICAATLTIEFLWDWRIRRPDKIRFNGRLYPASTHGDPPPNLVMPNALQRDLSGSGATLELHFTGDTPDAAPDVSVAALSADGRTSVTFGPQQGSGTRRYRVSVQNFSLDFATTAHIGLALWAQGRERIPPQRDGAWSGQPSIISTSDPRPPRIIPDVVQLASLPDASGECHARLTWNPGNPATNAAGYFIYESTESKILRANNELEPEPDKSLSLRLTHIKELFKTNPGKYRPGFTRVNAEPLKATSADVALPRGSTTIHLYVVLGMNAGLVESEWPSGQSADDHLQAFAAPRVMKPAPPTLEVHAILDKSVTPPVYRARIKVGSRPGPRVRKVELFRVRVADAAREVDTMGPAVASITSGGGGWTVAAHPGTSDIALVSGDDAPPGSWKRVFYRATAWSAPDPLRGYLAGRSPASAAAMAIVPPSTPPDLSPVTMSWPNNGAAGDVLLEWTSAAPIRRTPLGPHLLSVRAKVAGAVAGAPALIAWTDPPDKLPTAAPGSGSGVWLGNPAGPAPYLYRAYVRRASAGDAVGVVIHLTDPLGRVSERLVQIPSGSLLPAPEVHDLGYKVSQVPAGVSFTFKSGVPLTVVPSYVLQLTTFAPGTHTITSQLQGPLSAVPVTVVWPPGGNLPLTWRRVPGPGPVYTYQAFCRVPVGLFVVRLTSPDNRVADATLLVS